MSGRSQTALSTASYSGVTLENFHIVRVGVSFSRLQIAADFFASVFFRDESASRRVVDAAERDFQ